MSLAIIGLATFLQIPQPPRFVSARPLPSLPAVMVDRRMDGIHLADQIARKKNAQGRVIWIDATANLERTHSESSIVEWVAKLKKAGFNTLVLDVKPISGDVIYPSQIAPRLKEWRGKAIPSDIDPPSIFVRECKKLGLSLLASFNAFSEGHRITRTGLAFENKHWQTVLHEPNATISIGGNTLPLAWKSESAPSESQVSTVRDAANLPKDGSVIVFCDGNGRVVGNAKAIPRDGFALVAKGQTGYALRRIAVDGTLVHPNVASELVFADRRIEQQIPLITNPLHPEVVQRNLNLLKEFVGRYDVDGVIYDDRLRFGGMNADFSPEFRSAFEAWLKRKVNWPAAVYSYSLSNRMERGITPGPEYENWLIFRAKVIRDYVGQARKAVQEARAGTQFGVYVGSWYGEYSNFGSNYASPGTEIGMWDQSPAYAATGYANQLDYLMSGCYYRVPTIFDAFRTGKPIGPTVEAAARTTCAVVDDQTWSYAGLSLADFRGNSSELEAALQAACASSQGVMIFDLSHNIEPMLPVFARAFRAPAKAPHQIPGLLSQLRSQRERAIKNGQKKPALRVIVGTPGAGH